MDLLSFIKFTLRGRYIPRWLLPGLLIYIPGINFLSLGYLSKTFKILLIGNIGLPPWQEKTEIFFEGLNIFIIFVLYEAIPFFLYFAGSFFLSVGSGSWINLLGNGLIKLSYISLFFFSLFLPFAFASYSEGNNIKRSFEFEKIYNGIKEVLLHYLLGYIIFLLLLYVSKILFRIPYLVGFLFSSLFFYYLLLLSTYYFTQIYKRTNLTVEIAEKKENT